MTSAAVDPLANPKGVVRLCELCQKPAFVQCTQCRVTFYCGLEHQKVDWVGIHEKICQLLIPLRTPLPFASSEEERQHRKSQQLMRQNHMVTLTRTTGQKLLFEGKHAEAIPAAMQSLRFAAELYGLASVELVPSYLILGRASIGLDKLDQAEEYLLQARWTVLKTPECPNTIKHKLCRHLGLLYAAKGQYDTALRELADDIYYASEEFGTDHIRTSGGYYHMANIFIRQGHVLVASSLYDKVTEIWHAHLSKLVAARIDEGANVTSVIGAPADRRVEDENDLDEAQQAEALQVLGAIYDVRERQSKESPQNNLAKISHTLAMLFYILHNIDKAKEFGRKAVAATATGEVHDEHSRTLVEFMKVCENVKVILE